MNKPSQQELWEKIQNFQLDEPESSFPFSKKLAKQNNWSASFTGNAIAEYKKFIFLCCILPGGASPSSIVDEVWHLHLTYTDNYWNKFCKQTLQQDIHHHPSKGGESEKDKHDNWYDDTLKQYEEVFGSKPPESIWPAGAIEIPEISLEIYDPVFIKKIIIGFIAGTVIYAIVTNLFRTAGPEFLQHFAVIAIAGFLLLLFSQQHKRDRLIQVIWDYFPKDYSSFQMTRFLFGSHRAYQTALVDLLKRDIIEMDGRTYKIVSIPNTISPNEANPLLAELVKAFTPGDTFTYEQGLPLAEAGHQRHADIERLYRLSIKVDYHKFVIPGVVLLIGITRLFQGIANNKPVSLLVFEMFLFTFFVLIMLEFHSYTNLVRTYVKNEWLDRNNNGQGNDIINNFSILGTAAIAGFAEYTVLTSIFESATPRKNQSGGSDSAGCSSGDGSSGGDGGCGGGCGGCGGGD